MQRDGARKSIWQHKMPEYDSRPFKPTADAYDVLIVGGGVTGITTALELQKSGKRCIVMEAHHLCFGTTGGTTAHLNNFFDTPYSDIADNFSDDDAKLAAEAASEALALYNSNVKLYNIDCGHEAKDAFLFSKDDKQSKMLDDIVEGAKAVGINVLPADSIPVTIPFLKAVRFPDQAQIHASRYVFGLAKIFEDAGGVIVQQCRVESFSGDDVLEVKTSKGNIHARSLIWATHIPPGINILHFRCAPYRSYALAVKLSDNNYPDALIYDLDDPYHYYRTQEVDGSKYLIAGGEDHKTAHESDTTQPFVNLEAYIRQHFRVGSVEFAWSSQYFEPADGIAYIGHLPGNSSNVLVATGFGGNGMVYSHIAALLLTDLVVNGESRFKKLYDPNRIKPVAGFGSFVAEAADVIKEFVAKRIGRKKIDSLGEIKSGEGKIVKFEGEALAVYRDEDGGMHAVSTVCPHAKCAVGWNSAEKSWDCPCHGSRFDVDGEVLTGPSIKGLQSYFLDEA